MIEKRVIINQVVYLVKGKVFFVSLAYASFLLTFRITLLILNFM